jgi:hypothetical protein
MGLDSAANSPRTATSLVGIIRVNPRSSCAWETASEIKSIPDGYFTTLDSPSGEMTW